MDVFKQLKESMSEALDERRVLEGGRQSVQRLPLSWLPLVSLPGAVIAREVQVKGLHGQPVWTLSTRSRPRPEPVSHMAPRVSFAADTRLPRPS